MKLLLDEMFSAAIADGLRRVDIDAVAVQERPELRGLPDEQLWIAAQFEERCVVTENVADVVLIEAAWRAAQTRVHHGLVLVAPRAFPRHRRGAIGRLVRALTAQVTSGEPAQGEVAWLHDG